MKTAEKIRFLTMTANVLSPLLRILPLHNLIRSGDQLFEQFVGDGRQVDADPVLDAEVAVGRSHALGGVEQFGDALGLAFHHHSEVVEITVAEGVPADVEHQHGVAAGHLREGQFLLHLAQRETIFTEFFDIHDD